MHTYIYVYMRIYYTLYILYIINIVCIIYYIYYRYLILYIFIFVQSDDCEYT